jgi:4-oxalocrotonate tautomerase
MPYVSVRVAGKLTREQKTQIAKEFAETLKKVAQKPLDATYTVFDEVDRENWAKGDQLLG